MIAIIPNIQVTIQKGQYRFFVDAEEDKFKYLWDEWNFGPAVSYRLNDMLESHIGISGGWTEDGYGNKDHALGYEIATIMNISDNVLCIIPFFHVTDWGTREPVNAVSVNEGETFSAGIVWRIKL